MPNKISDKSIKIRPAIPNFNEGLVFAKLMNEASEGFFKSVLGNSTDEIIAEAFVKSNNEYSFENVLFIEYNSHIAGMISGYSLLEKKNFTKNIISEFSKGEKLRTRFFSVIAKILAHFLGPKKNNDLYIQGIAIICEMRGKGFGQKLLNHYEKYAVEKGFEIISLDVSSKNTKAIRSYKNFGMKIYSNWPNLLKIPPVFTRMVKEI